MNQTYLNSTKNTVLSLKPSKALRLLLMVLFVFLTPVVSFGQVSQTFNTSGTFTFTVPPGVTSLKVEAWGSGGGAHNSYNKAGGGGAYAGSNNVTVIPGMTYTIKVGAGADRGIGNDGEDSSFGTLVIAKGGKGGANSGVGGLASASTGETAFSGGNGGSSSKNGGAGGGGAGSTSADGSKGGNTADNSGGSGGSGGVVGGGNGGNGGDKDNSGIDGFSPGGGGGERGKNGSNTSSGGGGDGQVRVSWTCPADAGTLSGNQYICTYGTMTTTFASTVLGGVWTSSNTGIVTVNSSTGVVKAVSAGTATITYMVASSECTTRTASRTVYVANGPGGGVTSIFGSNSQCQGTSATYAITSNSANFGHIWTYTGSGVTFTTGADGRSATATFASNATSGNITVNSTNACGTNYGINLPVAIAPSSSGGSIPTNASGCANTYITNLGLTSQIGNPIRWESSTDNFATIPTIISTTANNINVTNLTQTTYYRAVVQNSPCTNIAYSNICKVTVNPRGSASVSIATSPSVSICSGIPLTFTATPTNGGSTPSYQWKLNGVIVGTNSASYTNAAITNGSTVTCVMISNSTCVAGSPATSNTITATVSPALSAPTIGAITQPTCTTATGSVVLNGLPAGPWVLTRIPGNVATTGSGTSTTIPALAAGTTYTYSVIGSDNGLKGEYFNNIDLSGTPVLTRTDATIGFDWINGSPDPVIGIDNFSVRWSGQVQPLYTENYTFTTRSDDGIRLWVNGTQIINNWTVHGVMDNMGSIMLTAGVKYDIVLEYYEKSGQAVSQLSWESATQPFEIIKSSQLFMTSCSSPASANVVINAQPATPAAPTGTAAQSFCSVATVANLSAIGSNIKWYAASLGGTALPSTTVLTSGTHYYASQNPSGCESTTRFDVTATVNTAIAANTISYTGAVTLNAEVAENSNAVLTAPNGNVFTNVIFASYGTPTGTNPNYILGTCHQTTSLAKVEAVVLGGSSVSIPATNLFFGDPCSGTYKKLYILASYAMPICAGSTPSTLIGSSPTGGNGTYTYLWESSTTSATSGFGSAVGTNNLKDYSPTSLTQTTWFRRKVSSTCGSITSLVLQITVNASPITPSLGTKTQPNCKTPTGTVTVTTPSPATGITYTITGTDPVVAAVTNTTGIFSGLAAGSYNVTTSTGSCTSSPIFTLIDPFVETTNDWNGTSWSNGTPNSNQKLVFAGDYPPIIDPNVDIEGCSCKITGSKTVKIKSDRTLTITNEVTVEGNGSLIFENNASLVQINNLAINKGDIEYQRSTNSVVRKTDYVYWSSPVLDLTLGELSKETANGTFYSFDTGTENWNQAYNDTPMDIGKGYIVRRPDFISGIPVMTEKYTAYFEGEPNNGIITFPIGFTGAAEGTSNLLGNPYPSAIDADKFLNANAGVLDGTLYFWTHNTALDLAGNIINPGLGWAYTYSLNDYASYNLTGGVGIQNAKGGVSAPSDPLYPLPADIIDFGKKPSGKIASGQGFFATSKKAGNVTFTNLMRVSGDGASGNNSQFFKTKNPKGKTGNTIEKNRIWLNLTNTEGAFKQTLIGYITDATNDYDNLFDGESFDSNEFVDFYSVYEDKNLVIQGRALPFEETDEVPLGYRTTIDGNFTINIDEVDGSMTDQAVFIEDKLTNTEFNLKTGNYTFSTAPGTFNDRFVLKYRDTSKTLAVDTIEKEDGILAFYSSNYNTLIIHNDNFDETVNAVALFNMAGQKIGVWDVRNSEQANIQVPIKNISSGIYIVKVTTTKGESSKKIIVN